MKKYFWILSLTLVTAFPSYAASPTAPEPYYEANLFVTTPPNAPAAAPVSYHLESMALNGDVESFVFTEALSSLCAGPLANDTICLTPAFKKVMTFTVTTAAPTDCGATKYTATAPSAFPVPAPISSSKGIAIPIAPVITLTLIDYTQASCEPAHPYNWVVNFSGGITWFPIPRQTLYGEAAPVEQNTNCSNIGAGTVCPQIALPTTCTATSVDGNKISPPVSASAINGCYALIDLKTQLCSDGYPYESMLSSDYTCVASFPRIVTPIGSSSVPPITSSLPPVGTTSSTGF